MVRASILVAGLWLGFLAASWVVATGSFRTAERVAGPDANAEVASRLAPVAAEDRRLVLRHLASELNRFMFRTWSLVQLGLGIVLAGVAWSAGGAPRVLAVTALLLVAVQAFGLTGPITHLGRSIDFVPRPLPPDVARRFGELHAAYAVIDLAKAAVLGSLSLLLLRRP
jgi:hypothetical protein